MPPALLLLFKPRPALEYKPPPATEARPKISGIAEFVHLFTKRDDLPALPATETPKERKKRLAKEKMEAHKLVLEERAKTWDPHTNAKGTSDAYKTLFVARLSYDVEENDLRDEFEKYGVVKDVKLVRDIHTGKSRGYAFIEFESSNDLKEAFKYADQKNIKGRRILVDVERGRTVPGWKPRKLGGGMGSSRSGNDDSRRRNQDDERYASRRDKYRDRDYRDRGRRRRSRSRSRGNRERRRRRRSRS